MKYMKTVIRFLIFIIIMGAVIGFFWYDEIKNWLSERQEQAEEQLPGLINQGANQARDWWQNQGQGWADQFVANLTSQGKQKIDQWLEENNLNEYGDEETTAYTGGTPLFEEATGETLNRYSYLLQKFPELVDELNLDQYLSNQ